MSVSSVEMVFVRTNNPNMEETGILENPILSGKCYLALNQVILGAWFKNASFQVTLWDRSANPHRSRLGAGLREPALPGLGRQFRENRVYPKRSSQCACGSPVSNSAGLFPARLGSSLRRYRRWFRKNWSNVK